jgi:hypothetical protein
VHISRIDSYVVAKAAVFIGLCYVLVAHMLPATLGTWRESNTIHALVITPAMRAEIVGSLADRAAREYWSEAKGKALAAFLREGERGGRYRLVSTPQHLAQVLTDDMRDVTGDQHAKVTFSPAEVPDVGPRSIDVEPSDETSLLAWPIDRLGRTLANFGVADVSISAAGVGYIKLTYFYRPFLASEKYAAAMKKVRDSRALVIDLREARGGYASSAALLASYFFDRATHLSDIEAPFFQTYADLTVVSFSCR